MRDRWVRFQHHPNLPSERLQGASRCHPAGLLNGRQSVRPTPWWQWLSEAEILCSRGPRSWGRPWHKGQGGPVPCLCPSRGQRILFKADSLRSWWARREAPQATLVMLRGARIGTSHAGPTPAGRPGLWDGVAGSSFPLPSLSLGGKQFPVPSQPHRHGLCPQETQRPLLMVPGIPAA